MPISNARRLAICVALFVSFTQAASAGEILIADAKSQPESLTVAPDGVLIVGSASSPFVYKVRSGSSTAEKFVDASAEGPGPLIALIVLGAIKRWRRLDGKVMVLTFVVVLICSLGDHLHVNGSTTTQPGMANVYSSVTLANVPPTRIAAPVGL